MQQDITISLDAATMQQVKELADELTQQIEQEITYVQARRQAFAALNAVQFDLGGGNYLARDQAMEGWLQTEVASAYDALKADPARALTPAQVRARLALKHQ
jgi:hypothetical protein